MNPDLDIRRACKLLHEYDYHDEAKLLDEACAMVRLLIQREWVGDPYPFCASCKINSLHSHRDDCEWLALMRRLGERP